MTSQKKFTLSRYFLEVVDEAWSESLDASQAVIFVAVIVLGSLIKIFPVLALAYSLPNILTIILSWEGATLVLLAVVVSRTIVAPFNLAKKDKLRLRELEDNITLLVASKRTKANTTADALIVEFENTDEFCTTSIRPDGSVIREINFRVVNNGDGFLTNCFVNIKNTHPRMVDRSVTTMSPGEPLIPGQYKWVRLASYAESVPPSVLMQDTIILGWHHGASLFGGVVPIIPPSVSQKSPAIVTVEISAPECRSKEASFKLWITTGRLHAERF